MDYRYPICANGCLLLFHVNIRYLLYGLRFNLGTWIAEIYMQAFIAVLSLEFTQTELRAKKVGLNPKEEVHIN